MAHVSASPTDADRSADGSRAIDRRKAGWIADRRLGGDRLRRLVLDAAAHVGDRSA